MKITPFIKHLSRTIALTTLLGSGYAQDVKVDINGQGGTTAAGWTGWDPANPNNPALNTGVGTFATTLATDGDVDVSITTIGGTYERNYGTQNASGSFTAATPAALWADQYFFNNVAGAPLTITIDDLKAGDYVFVMYHYFDDLDDTPAQMATSDVFINGTDSGINATSLGGVATPAHTATSVEDNAKTTIAFTVANDDDTVTLIFQNPTGNHFGLNGFLLMPPPVDTDGDGLPDSWEITHGLDPNDDGSTLPSNGASGDPDGDGLTNLQEYQMGSDPNAGPDPADITWSIETLNADADINNVGDLIEAAYFSGPSTSGAYPGSTRLTDPITVNTVTFEAVDFTQGHSLSSLTGLTYNGGEYGHLSDTTGHLALAAGLGIKSGQVEQTATLQGLEIGSTYAIQFIYYHATVNRAFTVSDGNAANNGTLSEAGSPVIGTGTFVADATTKTLTLTSSISSQFMNAYQLRRLYFPDFDGDGMPDSFENSNAGLDANNPSDATDDEDMDGSNNLEEYTRGTGVNDEDSDDDGRDDGEETGVANGGTDPLNPDTDNDGLSDGVEVSNSNGFVTDPTKPDTDGDTFDDAYEITVGSDPTNSASIPAIVPTSVIPSDLYEARKRGKLANQGFHGNNRYLDGWLARRHGTSMLINDGSNASWLPENAGADNYPFMVLAAWSTDPAEFSGSVLDMLNSEIANTSRSLGAGKPAIMPDHFHPGNHAFRFGSPDLIRQTFGASEYMKDGLLTLTELMGPTNNPWYDRMITIMDYMWENEANRLSDHGVGIINPHASQEHHSSTEAMGENLQILPRLYWQTGDPKYLDWAIRLGDHFLLDGPQHASSFHPTHGVATEIWLVDHGNEMLSGLTELYITLRTLADQGDTAAQAKVAAYQPRLYLMFDYIAQFGFDANGITHRRITTATSSNPGTVIPQVLNYAYGYLYYGFYMMYQIDKDSPDPALRAKVEGYRDMTRTVLFNLLDKDIDMIGHEDAFECTLNLYNEENDVPGVLAYLDNEAQRMFAQQRADGQFRRVYSDGNFGRSMLMQALWKTRGVRTDNWNVGLDFGAIETSSGLLLNVKSTGITWSGNMIFDSARHKTYLNLPIDTTRINEYPEWHTIDPAKTYYVTPIGGTTQTFTGQQLISGGMAVTLTPGEEKTFLIDDQAPAGGTVFVRNLGINGSGTLASSHFSPASELGEPRDQVKEMDASPLRPGAGPYGHIFGAGPGNGVTLGFDNPSAPAFASIDFRASAAGLSGAGENITFAIGNDAKVTTDGGFQCIIRVYGDGRIEYNDNGTETAGAAAGTIVPGTSYRAQIDYDLTADTWTGRIIDLENSNTVVWEQAAIGTRNDTPESTLFFSAGFQEKNTFDLDVDNMKVSTNVISATSFIDVDQDGIRDEYEVLHTGGLDTMDATSNIDGDHHSDLLESLSLTDPTDQSDYLTFCMTGLGSDDYHFEWQSKGGVTYHWNCSENLFNWNPLGHPIIGTGNNLNYQLSSFPSAMSLDRKFFRLAATRP